MVERAGWSGVVQSSVQYTVQSSAVGTHLTVYTVYTLVTDC